VNIEFQRKAERISVVLARSNAGVQRQLDEAYLEIQRLKQIIEELEPGELTVGKKNSRMQRSAPAPPPLISPEELELIKKELDTARTMSMDLRTAHIALTAEYDRLMNEKSQQQIKHAQELEAFRTQVRQLKENTVSLNVTIGKLEEDKAQLKKEILEQFVEMRSQRDLAVAAHQELHVRLAESLDKEHRTAVALDQVTARMASRLSPLKVIARWVNHAQGVAFRAWRTRVDDNQYHRSFLLVPVIRRWMQQSLAHVMDNWKRHALEQTNYRRVGLKIVKRWHTTHKSHPVCPCFSFSPARVRACACVVALSLRSD
jgi:predicted  nucleic acid-binding Zn-ribbon protein